MVQVVTVLLLVSSLYVFVVKLPGNIAQVHSTKKRTGTGTAIPVNS